MKTCLTMGVIGGGRMGGGIAHVFAALGATVTVVEPDHAARARSLDRIRESLERAFERGKLADAVENVWARVTTVGSVAELPVDCALVVEAVPELADVKKAVLAAAEAAVSDRCVIASNTSSLSITDLAQALRLPHRFIGMHFFNPAPASSLVEVVVGPLTDHAVTEQVVGWIRKLGKDEVVVRDSPGFATSRLGVLLGLEAIRMLEEGVADAASIDRAMELGYRHPMGPLRSTDLVGLDVRLNIAEHLTATLGSRFEPPALLREKVARGELGRKTGRGFFDWTS